MPDPVRMSTADAARAMSEGLKKTFGIDVTIKTDNPLSCNASTAKAVSEVKAGSPPSYDLMYQTSVTGIPLYEQDGIDEFDLKDMVEAAGGTVDDIVKTTVYLVEGQDRSRFASAYRRFFQDHSPTKSVSTGLTLGVKGLAPDCLVETDAVAYLRSRTRAASRSRVVC